MATVFGKPVERVRVRRMRCEAWAHRGHAVCALPRKAQGVAVIAAVGSCRSPNVSDRSRAVLNATNQISWIDA